MNASITTPGRCLNYCRHFFRVSASQQGKRDGNVLGRKTFARSSGVRNGDCVCNVVLTKDSVADICIDRNTETLLDKEELPDLLQCGLEVVFLSWGGEGRNRRAPHRSRLGGLRQACQVSGNLVDLLIVEIFVGYKCGHRLSCSLTNNAQKLSIVESMARQRFRKSAFAVLAVAKLAIIPNRARASRPARQLPLSCRATAPM